MSLRGLPHLIYHIIAIVIYLCAPNIVQAENDDDPPSFFSVYSSDGNEMFQAECIPKTADLIKCDFYGIRFTGPDPVKIANGEIESWNQLKQMNKNDLAQEMKALNDEKTRLKFSEKLNSPSTGPKTKDWLKGIIAAMSSGDAMAFIRANSEREKRTCKISAQSFSLEFKKIGIRKWLSTPAPGGMCKIVKIYELSSNYQGLLWEFVETRLTAGSTGGTCEGVAHELNKRTVWTWENPKVYELSCDFMTYDVILPH